MGDPAAPGLADASALLASAAWSTAVASLGSSAAAGWWVSLAVAWQASAGWSARVASSGLDVSSSGGRTPPAPAPLGELRPVVRLAANSTPSSTPGRQEFRWYVMGWSWVRRQARAVLPWVSRHRSSRRGQGGRSMSRQPRRSASPKTGGRTIGRREQSRARWLIGAGSASRPNRVTASRRPRRAQNRPLAAVRNRPGQSGRRPWQATCRSPRHDRRQGRFRPRQPAESAPFAGRSRRSRSRLRQLHQRAEFQRATAPWQSGTIDRALTSTLSDSRQTTSQGHPNFGQFLHDLLGILARVTH